jgi:hypothetical protein
MFYCLRYSGYKILIILRKGVEKDSLLIVFRTR